MKKAKEYAEEYLSTPDEKKDEKLVRICCEFIAEVAELGETRQAKSNEAITALFNQQADKWRAFAEKAGPEVRKDGFERLLKTKMPEAHLLWKAFKSEEYPFFKPNRRSCQERF